MPTLSPPQPDAPDVTTSCRNCGTEISTGKKFCSECGTPILFVSQAHAQLSALCQQCGTPAKTGAKFCGNCGASIAASVPAQVRTRAACPGCGAELKADAKFCSGCGQQIAVLAPQLAICHQCNAPLKSSARFCSSCGAATPWSSSPLPTSLRRDPNMLSAPEAITKTWELPPWPLGLTPPPPPLSGVIHKFSMMGNAMSRLSLAKVDNQSKPERRCPNCHRVVAADKKFCGGCGWLLK